MNRFYKLISFLLLVSLVKAQLDNPVEEVCRKLLLVFSQDFFFLRNSKTNKFF